MLSDRGLTISVMIAAVGITTLTGCSRGTSSATPASTTDASGVTDSTTPSPTPYIPSPSEWQLAVKITQKQCFGSAGCNISYQIQPTYTGSHEVGDLSVTYEVDGDESGPEINTFTTHGSEATITPGTASTSTSGVQLTAKVTDVSAH